MVTPNDEDSPLTAAVAGVVIAVTLLAGFGLLAVGIPWFWIAFPVGFGGLLPAAVGLVNWYGHRDEAAAERPDTTGEAAALATLRDRYASGEIDEVEFERAVERLLSTETVTDAEAYLDRTAPDGGGLGPDPDHDPEHETDARTEAVTETDTERAG